MVTLYLDTSSLVKLYLDEAGAQDIERVVSSASVIATSAVAYAETRSTFARRKREGSLTAAAFALAKRQFEADWAAFLVIDANEEVARSAGDLAERLALRGCDALHLASFEHILSRVDDDEVVFSSADERLTRAAKKLG